MPHLTQYPFKVAIPLPTDDEIGPDMGTFLRKKGQNC